MLFFLPNCDLVIWTDGSSPFLLGKGFFVIDKLSFCGTSQVKVFVLNLAPSYKLSTCLDGPTSGKLLVLFLLLVPLFRLSFSPFLTHMAYTLDHLFFFYFPTAVVSWSLISFGR